MKLTITKEQLETGLRTVQSVVASRTNLPALANVLIQADADAVELTTTDLDIAISCKVQAKVERGGSISVPAKRLFGVVCELASPEIEMDSDSKNRCVVRAGQSFYRFNGLPIEEFPPLQRFDGDRKITIPHEKMRIMLQRTSFATSEEESRYVLNGIFFSIKDGKIMMVATDGKRLALVEEQVEMPESMQGSFIVPNKAVNEIKRLLTANGELDMGFDEKQAMFRFRTEGVPETLLVTRLVDGNYPNFRQVIPTEVKEHIELNREEFLHALRRAECLTSPKQSSVKLSLSQNSLVISVNSPEYGEGTETIAINYQGSSISIAFNPKFLIDPLLALENLDNIYLDLIDELSPGVIKDNQGFLYVVMPMRLT